MTTITVNVETVSVKEGAKNGKAWKKYGVKADNGTWYSTFDATLGEAACGYQGQPAEIDVEQNGEYWNLKAIRPANGSSPGPWQITPTVEHPAANGMTPELWDAKDRRILRTGIYKSFLEGDSFKYVISVAGGNKPMSPPEFAKFVDGYARALIQFAEATVWKAETTVSHPEDDPSIPF